MTEPKKRGRKPTAVTPPAATPALNEPAFATKAKAAQELALLQDEQVASTQLLARKLNYEGSLEPASLIDGARNAMQRANMALFEFGAYLLLLKERVGHGRFLLEIEQLDGLEKRAAQQYMQVTLRFANAQTNAHLATLGKCKLLEMAVLDDEEIQTLAEGGSARGVALDDIDKMSVRELRQALRKNQGKLAEQLEEAQAELKDTQERLKFARKEARLLDKATPDEAAAKLRAQVEKFTLEAQALILGPVRDGMEQLHAHAQANGLTQEAWMAGQLSNVVLLCKQVAGRVGVQLVDGQNPDWVLAEPVAGRVSGGGEPSFDPNA